MVNDCYCRVIPQQSHSDAAVLLIMPLFNCGTLAHCEITLWEGIMMDANASLGFKISM